MEEEVEEEEEEETSIGRLGAGPGTPITAGSVGRPVGLGGRMGRRLVRAVGG